MSEPGRDELAACGDVHQSTEVKPDAPIERRNPGSYAHPSCDNDCRSVVAARRAHRARVSAAVRLWNMAFVLGRLAEQQKSERWQFMLSWGGKLGLPDPIWLATPAQEDEAARILWAGGAGCQNWSAC